MIKAEGIKDGRKVKVEYTDDGRWLFNGKENVSYQMDMEYEIAAQHPVGGTFFPEKDDPLNHINVIGNHFFDHNVVVETDLDIVPIPNEPGVVY